MKKRTIYLIPILILAAGALGMVGLLNMDQDQPRHHPEPRARIVKTQVVELGPVATDMKAFGTVISAQPVDLLSEVVGTVEAGDVDFRPGQTFRRGDILARVDDRQVELDRQTTVSDLLTALANFLPEVRVEFPDEFDRWQQYFNSISFDSVLPELPRVTNQRIKLYLSRFNVYKHYFAVRNNEIRKEKHTIRAPFDGAVVSVEMRPGSTARAGSKFGSVISLEELEVEVPLTAQDVPWIDFDRPVALESTEFEGTWEGRISRVGRSLDERTQTVPMYVQIGSGLPQSLPEGVFLEAAVPGKPIEQACEIPRRALYEDRFVYVVKDGKLEYRQIDVARFLRETLVVDGGLQTGDTLVVEPLQGVAPGMLAEARSATTADESL